MVHRKESVTSEYGTLQSIHATQSVMLSTGKV